MLSTRLLLIASGLAGSLAVGMGVGSALFSDHPPPSLAAPSIPDLVPVTPQLFDDSRPIEVTVILPETRTLQSTAAGRITKVSISESAELRSGEEVARVDATAVWALHTKVPLWRDLALGDHGSDVEALQEELKRLGYGDVTTGMIDSHTLSAIAALRKEPTSPDSVLQQEWFWIPKDAVRIKHVLVHLGDRVTAQDAFATVESAKASAHADVLDEAMPGARLLDLGPSKIPIGPDGVVDGSHVDELLATDAFQLALQQQPSDDREVQFRASWILEDPKEVWGIPASAIFEYLGRTCVINDHEAVQVVLVSSQLGLALVTSEAQLHAIQVSPPDGATCS